MDINCEMCNKKIATLTEEKGMQANIKIDLAVCQKCDDKLWDKLIKARQAKK